MLFYSITLWKLFIILSLWKVVRTLGLQLPEEICNLHHTSPEQEQILQRISPLKGKTLTTLHKEKTGTFTFQIGICHNPNGSLTDNAGAIQYDKLGKTTVLGRFNKTGFVAGSNWVMMTYYLGDAIQGPFCNSSEGMANIMIICDQNTEQERLKIITEQLDGKTSHCFHLFEFASKVACPEIEEHLSGGSVFCILFFTGVVLYLVLGFLYQRLVIGAQGIEQMPNFTFWKDFGNLQADGCDFACRCGSKKEASSYRGLDDNSPRNNDDQLLTM